VRGEGEGGVTPQKYRKQKEADADDEESDHVAQNQIHYSLPISHHRLSLDLGLRRGDDGVCGVMFGLVKNRIFSEMSVIIFPHFPFPAPGRKIIFPH
jgi:hypothetical protein